MNTRTYQTEINVSCLISEVCTKTNIKPNISFDDIKWNKGEKEKKKDLQSSSHVTDKLLTVFKEERNNLCHEIRATFILQLFQFSELIIQKPLHIPKQLISQTKALVSKFKLSVRK